MNYVIVGNNKFMLKIDAKKINKYEYNRMLIYYIQREGLYNTK